MAKVFGNCCICGQYREMSFEHVPPQSAFNNNSISLIHGEELFRMSGLVDPESTPADLQQRGAGAHTLCIRCNTDTGRYGRAYAEWAVQAAKLVLAARGEMTLAYQFRLFPLRVIKQVVCMFMSACGPGLRDRIPYLEEFVLNKRRTGLPWDVGIHVGLTGARFSRSAGITGLIAGGTTHVFAEVAFRPFVLIMTFASPCPERRMLEITSFAQESIDRECFRYLPLPLLDVRTQFPSDYRSEDEVLRQAIEAAKRDPADSGGA